MKLFTHYPVPRVTVEEWSTGLTADEDIGISLAKRAEEPTTKG